MRASIVLFGALRTWPNGAAAFLHSQDPKRTCGAFKGFGEMLLEDAQAAGNEAFNGGVEYILQKAAYSREDFLRQIRGLIGRYAVEIHLSVMDG